MSVLGHFFNLVVPFTGVKLRFAPFQCVIFALYTRAHHSSEPDA
jgi:hypothetical protein